MDGLSLALCFLESAETDRVVTYHAAPTTNRPIHSAMPRDAHVYGDTDSRNAPTSKASPLPVKSISINGQP